MKLKPFFCYYGGKYRMAPHYPSPKHETLIEPFAGEAGYATRYPSLNVILYDKSPEVCGVWDFIINSSLTDILNLPLYFDHVDELNISDEAKWLIGFWCNKGSSIPKKSPGIWMRGEGNSTYWGEMIRIRIAVQSQYVKHWKVFNKSYCNSPDIEATWFIDPPYNNTSGKLYKYQPESFPILGEWCKSRKGQVIVCEAEGSNWLPFKTLGSFISTAGKNSKLRTKEAVYLQDNGRCLNG